MHGALINHCVRKIVFFFLAVGGGGGGGGGRMRRARNVIVSFEKNERQDKLR